VALDDLLLVNLVQETEGDYVGLNINAEEAPFNHITMSYDAFTPAGTEVIPYYSLDGGQTWNEFTVLPKTESQGEFTRITYDERISDTATNTQIKFKITLKSSNRFVSPRVRRLTTLFKDAFTV